MFKFIGALAALALSVSAAEAQDVSDCSSVDSAGVRTLCREAVFPAEPARLWALWSDPEQLSTWMAPVATIDLRPGGMMEAAYDVSGHIGDPNNILNRVVAVDPMHSLSLQVERAPPGFPHPVEVRELVTVIEFAPAGEHATRVRVSMAGYREGQAFDELYAFFAAGNSWTLQKLGERITNGPFQWAEDGE